MNIKELFSNKPRCQHFSEDGSRCRADPQTGKSYCFFHDPDQKEKQAQARKQGGQIRSRPPETILPPDFERRPLQDLTQIHEFLEDIANYICRGEMDLRTGRTLTYVANSVLAVLKEKARQQHQEDGRAAKKTGPDHMKFVFSPIPRPERRADDHNKDQDHNQNQNNAKPQPTILGQSAVAPSAVPGKRNQPEDKHPARPDQARQTSPGTDSAASPNAAPPNQPAPQSQRRILHASSPFPPVVVPNKPAPPPQPSRYPQYGPDDIRKI